MSQNEQPNSEIITVKNLTKKYRDFTAVNDITFSVKKGQIFAFLGPNGAGKTTTIKMLTTLLSPTQGSIILNGFDPQKDKNSVRQSFGIVFQDPSLDDELTAYENLDFHGVLYGVPSSVRKQRIEQLLSLVELSDKRNELVKTFSGGMKRRLEIARGLLHHPKIFFLDEPTQGLDPQTRNKLWDYVKNLNKKENVTVFFTTHYIEEAEKYADYVAIIDRGRLLVEGTVEKIKNSKKATTLEEAFLAYTGREMRAEEASALEHLRMNRRMFRR